MEHSRYPQAAEQKPQRGAQRAVPHQSHQHAMPLEANDKGNRQQCFYRGDSSASRVATKLLSQHRLCGDSTMPPVLLSSSPPPFPFPNPRIAPLITPFIHRIRDQPNRTSRANRPHACPSLSRPPPQRPWHKRSQPLPALFSVR